MPYSRRRERFSRASFSGIDWETVRGIILDEYEWQKSDSYNVPRLYGKTIVFRPPLPEVSPANSHEDFPDTLEAAADGSGFTVLHQAAFAHAEPDFV